MRVLGLDLGARRIGIAISDAETGIALPAGFHERHGDARDVAALVELIRAEKVERVVVGLPLHLDGRAGEGARAAQRFAEELATASGLSVDTLDERWTTREAERAVRDSGASRRRRRSRGHVDSVAATIILRTYLDREAAVARSGAPERRE